MISDRKKQIIDIASDLLQTRSFSAFSFQDIADQLNVSKAAIHSHFRTKEVLGNALIDNYLELILAGHAIAESQASNAWDQFDSYVEQIVNATFKQNKACLATILLVEYNVIPESMRKGVSKVFWADEIWITKVLKQGLDEGVMAFKGKPEDQASVILSTIQSTAITGRAEGEQKFNKVIAQIKANMLPDN